MGDRRFSGEKSFAHTPRTSDENSPGPSREEGEPGPPFFKRKASPLELACGRVRFFCQLRYHLEELFRLSHKQSIGRER
jgi:hypothetical protein